MVLNFFVFLLLIPKLGFAYPWVFFKDTKKENYLEFDFHSSYFLKNSYSAFVGGKMEYHNTKIDIDLDYRYSLVERRQYARFGELSVNLPLKKDKLNIILGFRDFVWNEADRYWNLGLWQPRYFLDAFRPLQNSLPGIYFDYFNSSNTAVTFYFSYFYLPDVIIYPEVKNGVITSKNPYFSNTSFKGFKWNVKGLKPVKLEYFLQPLLAFQVYHQLSYSELFLSYAYKPRNQLQFFVQSEGISLSDSNSDITITGLDYDTVKHHLVTMESEIYLDDNFSIFASLFYERPEKLEVQDNWVTDGFEPHLTTSFLIYFKENLKNVGRTVFTLGYIQSFESQSKVDTSNIITEDLELIFGLGVNYWKHALSWSMEYWTEKILSGFQFKFRLNYALDNQIYATIFDTSVYVTPSLRAYVSGDIILRFAEHPIKSGTSLISKHRDLSRILLGVKYVF